VTGVLDVGGLRLTPAPGVGALMARVVNFKHGHLVRTSVAARDAGGDLAYGFLNVEGNPIADFFGVVEVAAAGRKVANFRWSLGAAIDGYTDQNGDTWQGDPGAPGPELLDAEPGGAVVLGATGLTANFAAGALVAGTEYRWTSSGGSNSAVTQTGPGPAMTLTGTPAGDYSGLVQISAGVGSLKVSTDNGDTFAAAISMGSLPYALTPLGVTLDVPDALEYAIPLGTRFVWRARGFFGLVLSDGSRQEEFEFVLADSEEPTTGQALFGYRSKLLSGAEWITSERPALGVYGV